MVARVHSVREGRREGGVNKSWAKAREEADIVGSSYQAIQKLYKDM